MQIVVIGTEDLQREFREKEIAEGIEVHFETGVHNAKEEADAYFYLLPEEQLLNDIETLKKLRGTVFVNAVVTTLKELPAGFIRMNAWRTFLRNNVEVSAAGSTIEKARAIFETMGWKYNLVADISGLVAARVVSMIVNEGYFAIEDKVSTKADIDIAMKLGTNYPFGPFEWSEKIGLNNIAQLLNVLAKTDNRYVACPALLKEIVK